MRQAVRPSGGRGVCGAEGSAVRIIDTLTNTHFFISLKHKLTHFAHSLFSNLSP